MSGENGPVKKIRSNSQKRYIMKPTLISISMKIKLKQLWRGASSGLPQSVARAPLSESCVFVVRV